MASGLEKTEVVMARESTGENVVKTPLVPPWSWVSFIGAVTGVLRARGIKCDFTSVAGMSGYAFIVNLAEQACPSGPTKFDWTVLEEGTRALGLDTELVVIEHGDESGNATPDAELLDELFERVRQEIDAGRCCVVWGATSAPEFAIVYGYRGNAYLVRSMRSVDAGTDETLARALAPDQSPEDPVPHDELQAPGGLGAVFFGEPAEVDRDRADRQAVTRAVQLLGGKHTCFEPGLAQFFGEPAEVDRDRADRQAVTRAVQLLGGKHTCFEPGLAHGVEAFGVWADAIEQGKVEPFGNSYNVHCYWELQLLAGAFCRRLGKRRTGATVQFGQAAEVFGKSSDNLERLKEFFPFPKGGDLAGPATRQGAARLLRECGKANAAALAALEQALALM
jgi:hypothetical protein